MFAIVKASPGGAGTSVRRDVIDGGMILTHRRHSRAMRFCKLLVADKKEDLADELISRIFRARLKKTSCLESIVNDCQ